MNSWCNSAFEANEVQQPLHNQGWTTLKSGDASSGANQVSYKLCGKLFQRLQGRRFLPGDKSTAPVPTRSGAHIKPLLPLELLILISSLQLLTPPYTPSAYTFFSSFSAARLSISPQELFPPLGMLLFPWQTFLPLSQLESISLKLPLATPDRCKFFLFLSWTSLCYYHSITNIWFKNFLTRIQTT